MIRDAFRYLRRAPQIAIAVATEPIEALIELEAQLMERREHHRPACRYETERDWEHRLHNPRRTVAVHGRYRVLGLVARGDSTAHREGASHRSSYVRPLQ
jgi:hypothetical protein